VGGWQVKEELLKLCDLQSLDIEIDRHERALAELDNGEKARLEVERLTADSEMAHAKKIETEKEYVDKELALKSLEEKKKKAEGLLYGGKVQNLKELEDLQKEVAMFGREIDKLSTRVLELMDELETSKQEEKGLQAELVKAQSNLQETLAQYEKDSAELEAELSALRAQRMELVGKIKPELVKRYKQLRARYGLIAVVPMTNELCGGCHVAVPNSLLRLVQAATAPQICEFCGRMLVWTKSDEENDDEEE
jgi:predicted  nucleic acid-binding Zn-ribbon protein